MSKIKKKLLFVIDTMRNHGGAQNSLRLTLDGLIKTGKYDIDLLTFYIVKDEYKVNKNVMLNTLNAKRYNNSLLRALYVTFIIPTKIVQYLRYHKECYDCGYDAIISNGGGVDTALLLAKKMYNIKLITTCRSNPFHKLNPTHKLRHWYKHADHVVCLSSSVKKEFVDNGILSRDKVSTIGSPLDIEHIKTMSRKRLPHNHKKYFSKNVTTLLAIGRLHPEKNWNLLLTTIAELNKLSQPYNLLFLGDGPQKAELKQLVKKLGLTKQVHFLGNVDNVYPYIKHASMTIVTSLYEGFCRVIAESVATGTPVVSHNCMAGPSEILLKKNSQTLFNNKRFDFYLSSCGTVSIYNNVKSLRDAIVHTNVFVKKDDTVAKCANRYNVDNITKKWVKVINKCLD